MNQETTTEEVMIDEREQVEVVSGQLAEPEVVAEVEDRLRYYDFFGNSSF